MHGLPNLKMGIAASCKILVTIYRPTSALFWGSTQRRLIADYRRYWTTYRSLLQG